MSLPINITEEGEEILRLKAELKAISEALDDPRTDLTLTMVEVIQELKAELAGMKSVAESWYSKWLANSRELAALKAQSEPVAYRYKMTVGQMREWVVTTNYATAMTSDEYEPLYTHPALADKDFLTIENGRLRQALKTAEAINKALVHDQVYGNSADKDAEQYKQLLTTLIIINRAIPEVLRNEGLLSLVEDTIERSKKCSNQNSFPS